MSWDESRAKDYDRLEWVNDDLDRVVAAADVSSKSDVLDVGTGTGAVARALAPYVNSVHGIDVCKEMLSAPRPGTTEVVDIEQPWHTGGRYDIVVARMVLHHTSPCTVPMINIFDVLKRGGRLVAVEGIPPGGCWGWYTEMFKLKEDRIVFDCERLQHVVGLDLAVRTSEVFVQPGMSLRGWLNNSSTDEKTRKAVWDFHVDAPEYVKHAYNMRFVGGDILMDWQACIVVGVKE